MYTLCALLIKSHSIKFLWRNLGTEREPDVYVKTAWHSATSLRQPWPKSHSAKLPTKPWKPILKPRELFPKTALLTIFVIQFQPLSWESTATKAWNHRRFTFKLNVESSKQEQTPRQRMTKRKILSQIARIFNPLCLLLRLMPLETQVCAYFSMRLLKHLELALIVDGLSATVRLVLH